MLNTRLGFVLFFVKDPVISVQFYQQIFGLMPIEQSPTFALFALDNVIDVRAMVT